MNPTWYDVLDVDRDATDEEIRSVWRAAIADLDPSDRRFRSLNQAAEVLLDPRRRSEYDARLAGHPAPVVDAPVGDAPVGDAVGPVSVIEDRGARRPAPRLDWLLVGLALLTAAAVAITAWQWTERGPGSTEEATRTAQAAAERAIVPILSYDHTTLAEDQERAQGYMTGDYREDYDELFAVIEENAPSTQTTVEVEVLASGIVRSGTDRVQVLLFLDRPTTNKVNREPMIYRDQVTVTMEKVDDSWLVDDLVTSPVQQ